MNSFPLYWQSVILHTSLKVPLCLYISKPACLLCPKHRHKTTGNLVHWLPGAHLTFKLRISFRCCWSLRLTSRIRLPCSTMTPLFSASALRSRRTSSSLPHFSSSSSFILETSAAGLSALCCEPSILSILYSPVEVDGKKYCVWSISQNKTPNQTPNYTSDNSDKTLLRLPPPTLVKSAVLHRFHFGCASLPRPCCSSVPRPVLCCFIPAVRASVCMLLCLWLSPRMAWRLGSSLGACRPPWAPPQLSAHYSWPTVGEERRMGRTARRGCRCIAGEPGC